MTNEEKLKKLEMNLKRIKEINRRLMEIDDQRELDNLKARINDKRA